MTAKAGRTFWKTPSALPGFSLSLGFTLAYLSLFVLIPLTALAIRPWENGWNGVIEAVASPRAQAALGLSFVAAAAAALINAVTGGLLAWVLARYDFPGKRIAAAIMALGLLLVPAGLFADGRGVAAIRWIAARFSRGKRKQPRASSRVPAARRRAPARAARAPRRRRG